MIRGVVRTVGFVGLGDQGGPMAVAIAAAGYSLHAWARRPSSYEALSAVEFERHAELESLAGSVDLLAFCLRDDADIGELITEQRLLESLQPGVIVANHGTGDPKENERLGSVFAASGALFVDAPVSGGRPGAVARTLTTMVGGDKALFDACEPVFKSFSRKVAHMGPLGAGQLTKLLNNALTMTNLKNAADVFAIASKLGLDLISLQDVFLVSSGSSAILQAIGTQIDAEAATHLQSLMRKDIGHFADAVRARGLDPSELRERGIGGANEVVRLARSLQRDSAGALNENLLAPQQTSFAKPGH